MKPTVFLLLLGIIFSCQDRTLYPTSSPTPRPASVYDSVTLADLPRGVPVYRPEFSDSLSRWEERGSLLPHRAPHFRALIGQYRLTAGHAGTSVPLAWGLDTLDPVEARRLEDFHLTDAVAYVCRAAEDHRLLMVAESHGRPEHRAFTRRLLRGLYARGYRHLGLENINPFPGNDYQMPLDSHLSDRGYPLTTALTGFYPSEPQYGNLIREAVRLGFQIFAYEQNGGASERDLQQAEHIVVYQRRHPGEKIVCHGGWFHAIESDQTKGEGAHWMAYHYRQLTGDDPLTVYQDALNEKYDQPSSPYYEALLRRDGPVPAGPQVVLDAAGEPWHGPGDTLPFDLLIFSGPPVVDDSGLPRWMREEGEDHGMVPLPAGLLAGLAYPVIVTAVDATDSDLATPEFAWEISGPGEISAAPLRRGVAYRWTARDARGGENRIVP